MKKILLNAMLCLLLVGCGVTQEEHDKAENERKEAAQESLNSEDGEKILEEASAVDGFLYASANYEKYNSHFNDDELMYSLIYIEGKVLNQEDASTEDMLSLKLMIEQEDGNKWCVGIPYINALNDIENKNVRVFGSYTGFFDTFNAPSLLVVDDNGKAKIEIKDENRNYKTIWSFQDYYQKDLEQQEKDKKSNTNEDKIIELIERTTELKTRIEEQYKHAESVLLEASEASGIDMKETEKMLKDMYDQSILAMDTVSKSYSDLSSYTEFNQEIYEPAITLIEQIEKGWGEAYRTVLKMEKIFE